MANLKKWFPFKRELMPHGNIRMHGGMMGHPLALMQREMNRLFEQVLPAVAGAESPIESWFGDYSAGRFVPTVDLADEGKFLSLTVELPGLEAKDVDITLLENAVRIRGEKKVENVNHGEEGYYRTECSYGAFERTIPLPTEVDPQRSEARFKNGLLAIKLPKKGEARDKGHRLEIQGA
jgi:HSP20 family protein